MSRVEAMIIIVRIYVVLEKMTKMNLVVLDFQQYELYVTMEI